MTSREQGFTPFRLDHTAKGEKLPGTFSTLCRRSRPWSVRPRSCRLFVVRGGNILPAVTIPARGCWRWAAKRKAAASRPHSKALRACPSPSLPGMGGRNCPAEVEKCLPKKAGIYEVAIQSGNRNPIHQARRHFRKIAAR